MASQEPCSSAERAHYPDDICKGKPRTNKCVSPNRLCRTKNHELRTKNLFSIPSNQNSFLHPYFYPKNISPLASRTMNQELRTDDVVRKAQVTASLEPCSRAERAHYPDDICQDKPRTNKCVSPNRLRRTKN